MRADAETARLQEDEEARVQRRAAEDALLERAAEVSRARDAAARQLPASQEPKRGKAHWDFVMEEMAWMAKEFQRCGPGPALCALAKVCASEASCARTVIAGTTHLNFLSVTCAVGSEGRRML